MKKDAGTILLEERPAEIQSPIDAQRLGIGIIYQDFKLVDELTVSENILLGQEPQHGRFVRLLNRKREKERAKEVLGQMGEDISTDIRVGQLSTAKRQIIEIAKALSRSVRILVLDEPSAALTDHELRNLFAIIGRLRSEGVGIIYISHRLDEVFDIGDRVTVLRDGAHIHTAPVQEVDRKTLIRHMVGRELEQEYPKVLTERGSEILRLEGISSDFLDDISFSVFRGEVFGIAGLVGAGRSTLAHTVFGAGPKHRGRMFLDGKEFDPKSPQDAINAGVGFLTEDRNRYGLILPMNVRENVSLSNLGQVLRGIMIDRRKERGVAESYAGQLRIKAPSVESAVEGLSGGNRQKVILARWLFTQSRLLIFDEPTAGIDVGAKREIYLLINELVQRGVGIIILSSELPELLGMCDRIAVMCEGRVTGIVSRVEATQESILALATQFPAEGVHAR